MKNNPYLTLTNILVAINILVFFTAPSLSERSGLELYFSQNGQHHTWQYLTHMFMHASLSHLLFNMFGLWMFGQALEKIWGVPKFSIFYIACGLGAALFYMLILNFQFAAALEGMIANGMSTEQAQDLIQSGRYLPGMEVSEQAARIFATPMVGASGAIYGILVAFALLFPNHKLMLIFLPIPIAAKYFVPAILALDLFSGVTGVAIFSANTAHFAHVGGAIMGFLLMLVWRHKANRSRDTHST